MEGSIGPMQPVAVLIADDDARFRAVVRSLLEADGYRVVAEAADVPAAIEATALHRPDVVVLDLVMEGAQGLSGVEDLHRLDPHLPVIVISSLFDPLLELQAVKMGAWYLEKVEGVEALEHAIDLAVSVRHPA